MTAPKIERFKTPSVRGIGTVCAICLFQSLSQGIQASTKYWDNPTSGSWFTGSNWSGGTAPIDGDLVSIGNSGTAISNGITATLQSVFVGDAAGSSGTVVIEGGGKLKSSIVLLALLSNSAGTISISGSGSELDAFSGLRIGEQGSGSVSISAGAKVYTSDLLMGALPAANGTLAISGAGSQLHAGSSSVGEYGTGAISIAAGGSVQAAETSLGRYQNSYGAITISGAQSTWQSVNDLRVGLYGTAELTLSDSASIHVGAVTLAENSSSSGTINFGSYSGGTTSGTLTASGITFGSGTATINFNQTDALTFSTEITGAGAVAQRGTGTTTVSTVQTYAGTTTVSAGTLLIDGHLSSEMNTVEVQENGTLGGIGAISGATFVSGTLSPGSGGTGQLSIFDDLSLASSATVVMELHSASEYDQLLISGSLFVAETASLKILLQNGYVPDEGTVFSLFLGSLPTFGGDFIALPSLPAGLLWNSSSLGVTGQIEVVPEPSSIALCLAAVALFVLSRCRTKNHEGIRQQSSDREEILLRR